MKHSDTHLAVKKDMVMRHDRFKSIGYIQQVYKPTYRNVYLTSLLMIIRHKLWQ